MPISIKNGLNNPLFNPYRPAVALREEAGIRLGLHTGTNFLAKTNGMNTVAKAAALAADLFTAIPCNLLALLFNILTLAPLRNIVIKIANNKLQKQDEAARRSFFKVLAINAAFIATVAAAGIVGSRHFFPAISVWQCIAGAVILAVPDIVIKIAKNKLQKQDEAARRSLMPTSFKVLAINAALIATVAAVGIVGYRYFFPVISVWQCIAGAAILTVPDIVIKIAKNKLQKQDEATRRSLMPTSFKVLAINAALITTVAAVGIVGYRYFFLGNI